MEFKFNHNNKNLSIDVEECRNVFSKARGLMFRKKSKPLLFFFNGVTKQAIHSFFCVPFIAIWFKDDKIIDVKLVNPWIISVIPREKFDKLLEIPINSIYFSLFIDGYRKL